MSNSENASIQNAPHYEIEIMLYFNIIIIINNTKKHTRESPQIQDTPLPLSSYIRSTFLHLTCARIIAHFQPYDILRCLDSAS